MSQLTSQLGRMKVLNPEIHFDTADGGNALYSALTTMFQKFSDNITGRWFPELSVTTSGGGQPSVDVIHNFGVALSELKYVCYIDGILHSKAMLGVDFTVTAPDTNTLRFTTTSAAHTLEVYVWAVKPKIELIDLDSEVSSVLNLVLPVSSVLSGTYYSNVLVTGNCTLGSDITIYGSLTVQGSITGSAANSDTPANGFSMTIYGDLNVSQEIVSNGSSPVSSATTNGGNGGSITVYGNMYCNYITMNGGNNLASTGTGIAGSGGSITVSGNLISNLSGNNGISLSSGTASGTIGSSCGSGGSINVLGNLLVNVLTSAASTAIINVNILGIGALPTSTPTPGRIFVLGNFYFLNYSSTTRFLQGTKSLKVQLKSSASGSGVSGGKLIVGGDFRLHGQLELTGSTGATLGTGGSAGTVALLGDVDMDSFAMSGGSCVGGSGGSAGAMEIGGNLRTTANCTGNGGATAAPPNGGTGGSGLIFTLYGSWNTFGWGFNGGSGGSSGNGGNGGTALIRGNILSNGGNSAVCNGGLCSSANQGYFGGNGGSIDVSGYVCTSGMSFNANGGNGANDTGGTGGVITFRSGGNVTSITANGGSSLAGTYAAGSAGSIRLSNTKAFETRLTDGATGNAPVLTGTLTVEGFCEFYQVNVTNRAGLTIVPNSISGFGVILKVGTFTAKNTLRNNATDTAALTTPQAEIYSHSGNPAHVWYKHAGTAA